MPGRGSPRFSVMGTGAGADAGAGPAGIAPRGTVAGVAAVRGAAAGVFVLDVATALSAVRASSSAKAAAGSIRPHPP